MAHSDDELPSFSLRTATTPMRPKVASELQAQQTPALTMESSTKYPKEVKRRYNKLVIAAKAAEAASQLEEALQLYLEAYSLCRLTPLERKIDKLRALLADTSPWSIEGDHAYLANKFCLPNTLYSRLAPFQRDQLQWLWESVHNGTTGGFLPAAEALQPHALSTVCAYICGLVLANEARHILFVTSSSQLRGWMTVFQKDCDFLRIAEAHREGGDTSKSWLKSLRKIIRKGGLCATSYATLLLSPESYCPLVASEDDEEAAERFQWDYVVFTEADQRLLNHTSPLVAAAHQLYASHRLLVCARPNAVYDGKLSLTELWSLVGMACNSTEAVFGASCVEEFVAKYTSSPEELRRRLGSMMCMHGVVVGSEANATRSRATSPLEPLEGNWDALGHVLQEQYNEHIRSAAANCTQGNALKALEEYLRALLVHGADPHVHHQALLLAHRLQLTS